jgi:hypothetical protein
MAWLVKNKLSFNSIPDSGSREESFEPVTVSWSAAGVKIDSHLIKESVTLTNTYTLAGLAYSEGILPDPTYTRTYATKKIKFGAFEVEYPYLASETSTTYALQRGVAGECSVTKTVTTTTHNLVTFGTIY